MEGIREYVEISEPAERALSRKRGMRRAIIGCGVAGLALSAGMVLGGRALLGSYERGVERVPGVVPPVGERHHPAARPVGEDRGGKAAGAAGEVRNSRAAKKDEPPVAPGAGDGENRWRPMARRPECSPFLEIPGFPCRDRAR
ncbi:hypothetical protein IMZ11_15370 [Microtetraspora sp. AC03309]|uniref:hypothetical protein n=1 Tax=Microtetraspora sp. AC03309 TaxID=2779376 RepID=UPI001E64A3DA|nr:hypothetical protein [Microtetraspora sp. AC03309]MCC5577007.1 hypothetical protein [Microtetraspora sp. AC03309]